jgi:hypothetical protein
VLARWVAIPRADSFKLPLALTGPAHALGYPVAVYGIGWRQLGGLVFYGERQLVLLDSAEQFAAWMAGTEPRLAYVDREEWENSRGDGTYPVVAASDYRKGTLLVSNGREETR